MAKLSKRPKQIQVLWKEGLLVKYFLLLCALLIQRKEEFRFLHHQQQIFMVDADVNLCIQNCNNNGYKCTSHTSSQNQYMSCAMACYLRWENNPNYNRVNCINQCDATRSCSRSGTGFSFGLCGSCPAGPCAQGICSTAECHYGCNWLPTPSTRSETFSVTSSEDGHLKNCIRHCNQNSYSCISSKSSSNRYMSCAQGCYLRWGSWPRYDKRNCIQYCDAPQSCIRSGSGFSFNLCGPNCAGSSCPLGVCSTAECHMGCSWVPTLSISHTVSQVSPTYSSSKLHETTSLSVENRTETSAIIEKVTVSRDHNSQTHQQLATTTRKDESTKSKQPALTDSPDGPPSHSMLLAATETTQLDPFFSATQQHIPPHNINSRSTTLTEEGTISERRERRSASTPLKGSSSKSSSLLPQSSSLSALTRTITSTNIPQNSDYRQTATTADTTQSRSITKFSSAPCVEEVSLDFTAFLVELKESEVRGEGFSEEIATDSTPSLIKILGKTGGSHSTSAVAQSGGGTEGSSISFVLATSARNHFPVPTSWRLEYNPRIVPDNAYPVQVKPEHFSIKLVQANNPNGLSAVENLTHHYTSAIAPQDVHSPLRVSVINGSHFEVVLDTLKGYQADENEVFEVRLNVPFFLKPEESSSSWSNCPPPTEPVPLLRVTIISTPDPVVQAVAAATTAVTAVAVSSSIAVGGAAVAGDAQSLALLSMMSCTQPVEKQLTQNTRLLSPLALDNSLEGIIWGNFILVTGVVFLQLAVVYIIKNGIGKRYGWKWFDVSSKVRYPGLTFVIAILSHQGTGASALQLLFGSEVSSSSLVLAIIAATVCLLLPIVMFVTVKRHLTATFQLYDWKTIREDIKREHFPDSKLHFCTKISVVLPIGRWTPQHMRTAYGALFSGLGGRRELLWSTQPTWAATLMILGTTVKPSSKDGCVMQFGWLAAFQLLMALITIVFRPLRSLPTNILSAISSCCLAIVFSASATLAEDPQSPKARWFSIRAVQAQLAITVIRLMYVGFVVLLEKFVLGDKAPKTDLFGWEGSRSSSKQKSDNDVLLSCDTDDDTHRDGHIDGRENELQDMLLKERGADLEDKVWSAVVPKKEPTNEGDEVKSGIENDCLFEEEEDLPIMHQQEELAQHHPLPSSSYAPSSDRDVASPGVLREMTTQPTALSSSPMKAMSQDEFEALLREAAVIQQQKDGEIADELLLPAAEHSILATLHTTTTGNGLMCHNALLGSRQKRDDEENPSSSLGYCAASAARDRCSSSEVACGKVGVKERSHLSSTEYDLL